jgi:acetyl-CoA carboxylase alpha subunit
MAISFLDFEQPIAELEAKIEELRHVKAGDGANIQAEIARLENKAKQLTRNIFSNLSPLADHATRASSATPVLARLSRQRLHRFRRDAR